ncbi:UDP-glucose:glycoprotein glucosyltransferases [Striga asiatica]|uniref:UDP-glucose:glycoprotein glucosyltransferases n=1 Tax=Striga asiatica TaxID=4170 RepID=A0A5A7QDF3_STRAF|nr:UDP-glucose:glycoprotein glucosyltransferases [Striga asiatica]
MHAVPLPKRKVPLKKKPNQGSSSKPSDSTTSQPDQSISSMEADIQETPITRPAPKPILETQSFPSSTTRPTKEPLSSSRPEDQQTKSPLQPLSTPLNLVTPSTKNPASLNPLIIAEASLKRPLTEESEGQNKLLRKEETTDVTRPSILLLTNGSGAEVSSFLNEVLPSQDLRDDDTTLHDRGDRIAKWLAQGSFLFRNKLDDLTYRCHELRERLKDETVQRKALEAEKETLEGAMKAFEEALAAEQMVWHTTAGQHYLQEYRDQVVTAFKHSPQYLKEVQKCRKQFNVEAIWDALPKAPAGFQSNLDLPLDYKWWSGLLERTVNQDDTRKKNLTLPYLSTPEQTPLDTNANTEQASSNPNIPAP